MTIEDYKSILSEKLTAKRYFHSLCVADEAERLAKIYGADSEKAYLAGLLHDITKNLPEKEHLKIFERFGIMLTDIEKNAFKLWHAISGSVFLEKVLDVNDREILSAVRYHTTAKEEMNLLEKVLYIADFTSKDRDYEDVDVMRKLADESLESAMIYALKYTINELCEKNAAIHPDTLNAFNKLMLRNEEK